MNNADISAHFTTQLIVILLACFVVGRLVTRIGQPPVVGEMIAGVLLGPSLFGVLAPGWQANLFPREGPTMAILYTMSQIGLVLYMFVAGLEFDVGMVRRQLRTAGTVSASGLFVPLLLGLVLALGLTSDPGKFFAKGVPPWQAGLFLGAAIATTAFPMLARIISERGIAGTRVGTLALASGATTDAFSWILLAGVVAIFHNDPKVVVLALGGGSLYAAFLLTGGRKILAWVILARSTPKKGSASITPKTLVLVLLLVLSAGWYTNAVGIHSIFGGFLLGVVVPRGPAVQQLASKVEPIVKSLLLPLFFVYSGLNTQLGLLDSPLMWLITALVIGASVLGKGVACYYAGRAHGLPKYESVALGSLMNARGLIELILLNIGLQAGIITPALFAILVLMAVVTTLTTAPLFNYAARRGNFEPPEPIDATSPNPQRPVETPQPVADLQPATPTRS